MVKHMIIWTLKDMPEEEKAARRIRIKEGLEGLVGVVPGLLEARVIINRLPSSSGDLMLDTTLESPEALAAYRVHPAHVAVANAEVRPYTAIRSCLDYEI